MKDSKKQGHIIKLVYPDSIAEELEIEAGDVLLEINGNPIEDVFDYRYLINDEYIEVLIRKSNGEEWLLEIDKEYDEDLGIEFENSLMSEYRSCSNKCIFCFIDQMPPGMRDTLYFKDDDSRLSFLQGNYITLTNMQEKDIDRIIHMQLAPINISVQSTNPELRCKLLHNRFAGDKLKYIDKLYENHIEMNGQIVCCKGVNDGEELRRSITDLMKYLPYMRSVSVVPAGVTKFRDNLYPIEAFSNEDACDIIDMIESFQKQCFDEFGLHFIHASDEFYILAERDFPEEERYDGYIQLENGVGMMRLFATEFDDALEAFVNSKELEKVRLKVLKSPDRYRATIPTGKLAYGMIKMCADKLMEYIPGLEINVCEIKNHFFGETITVTGLITGQDLKTQLNEIADREESLGERVIISSSMLRSGEEVFLDDMTVDGLSEAISTRVVPIDTTGEAFLEALINPDYCMGRSNDDVFAYIKAYED